MTRSRPAAWLAPAAALVVFAGLAVVTLASRGGPGDGTAAAYEAPNGDRFLLVGFSIAVAIATALALWAMWPDGRERTERPPSSWWRQYVLSLVVLFLLVGIGALRDQFERREDREQGELTPAITPEDVTASGDGSVNRASGTATVALAIVVTAGVAAVLLLRVARRRHSRSDTADGEDVPVAAGDREDPHVVSLPETFDEADVAAEPDARRAVLLAYALLERRLASTSLARGAAATPHEWLRHVASRGDAELTSAARTLTVLYERARFSARAITPDDRSAAVDALRSVAAATAAVR